MDEAEFRDLLLSLRSGQPREAETPALSRKRAALMDLLTASADLDAEAIQVLADLARRLALQGQGGVGRN